MRLMRLLPCVAALAALIAVANPLAATKGDVWRPLVERLVEDGLPGDYVDRLFARPEVSFQPRVMARKMISLLRIKTAEPPPQPVAPSPSRTTEEAPREPAKPAPPPRPKVYERYMQPALLASAQRFMEDHADVLQAAESERGVEREVLVAIMLVETRLGSYLGKGNAFVNLASMALAEDFLLVQAYLPMNSLTPDLRQWLVRRTLQKANWAYEELLAFISFAMASGLDPLNVPSSPYGAIGLCQFMPSNAVRFGVDGDGDGVVDLFSPADALHSIANYLAFHGWRPGLSEERQERLIMHYNRDSRYARTVVVIAQHLAKARAARQG